MEKSNNAISYFFLGFTIFALFAFFKTYFGQFPTFNNSITTVTHYHALTIVLWLAMLIVQPILIRKKQFEWHRRIGKVSYVLMPLLILGLLMIVHQEQSREKNLAVFAANLLDIPVLIILYGLAMFYRKNTPYHVRFILLTIVPFVGPATARLHIDALPINIVYMASLLIIEYFIRKIYKPYLIGIGLFLTDLFVVIYLFLINPTLLEKIWSLFWG